MTPDPFTHSHGATGATPTGDRPAGRSVAVWDLPVRLFHWGLVALVAVNLYTGLVGGLQEMDVHMASGYAILALVLFRLVWGVVGSRHARFTDFVRGPRTVAAYARGLLGGATVEIRGHNPLGGWSVVALLASLLVQATTGLFTSDDIFVEGPLAKAVPAAVSDWLSWVHDVNSTVLMVLIAIHLSAIAFYHLVKKENLIRAMITGRKPVSAADRDGDGDGSGNGGFVHPLRAAVILAVAAALVWAIVAG